MSTNYLVLAFEQYVNDADPSDEQLNELLRQIREAQTDRLTMVLRNPGVFGNA